MRVLPDAAAAATWLHDRGCTVLGVDSRQLPVGGGFIAWPGAATDGRRFVPQALANGAVAALVEHDGVEAYDLADGRVAAVSGLKALSGEIAALFHGRPSEALDLVAFTGTNGKTSSAWWLTQLLNAAGQSCALVGTLGMGRPGTADWTVTGLTTPDPVSLQAGLRRFADGGVLACAIEASSIGLAEGRLNGCHIAVAAFTNFTQDHLDYHGDMATYWAAKRALFDWNGLRAAVVNVDDPQGAALAAELTSRIGLDLWTVSRGAGQARLRAADLTTTATGVRFVLAEQGGEQATVELPLVGDYNVSNLLGVVAAARALGLSLAEAVLACAALTPVPGRMQSVAAPRADQSLVLVDYAHTPDALEQALRALQPLAQARGGQLWCVVGCGGDRDASKRPLMAAVAEREANRLCLTSDNPRNEDPQVILRQMVAGLRAADVVRVEPDRARAIAEVVGAAAANDVVLIAGKGHEDYQEVRGHKLSFSDVEQAAAALVQREVQA